MLNKTAGTSETCLLLFNVAYFSSCRHDIKERYLNAGYVSAEGNSGKEKENVSLLPQECYFSVRINIRFTGGEMVTLSQIHINVYHASPLLLELQVWRVL